MRITTKNWFILWKIGQIATLQAVFIQPYSAAMLILGINYLNTSTNLLLVIFIIVCLLMSLLIMMQRPKQEGLGAAFGSQMTDQMFGARTTNVLQRGTVYLATTFFLLTITLAILMQKKNQVAAIEADAPAKVEQASAPAAPVVPESKAASTATPTTNETTAPAPVEKAADAAPTAPVPVEPAKQEAPAAPADAPKQP